MAGVSVTDLENVLIVFNQKCLNAFQRHSDVGGIHHFTDPDAFFAFGVGKATVFPDFINNILSALLRREIQIMKYDYRRIGLLGKFPDAFQRFILMFYTRLFKVRQEKKLMRDSVLQLGLSPSKGLPGGAGHQNTDTDPSSPPLSHQAGCRCCCAGKIWLCAETVPVPASQRSADP
ncbi:hypothetical protein COLO4_02658 [Corchorus olitorius]|uniref:Uncharacterized protein n=1 Tax=Corchorus olitorius TaxID=93759 RepID=A0A1R3L0P6_9ROSI|nr:hypothetical protein COLO4_02658 [Corchorus olitorius]